MPRAAGDQALVGVLELCVGSDRAPAELKVDELVREIVEPYRAGLGDRIQFDVDVPPSLPPAFVDRTLTSCALANVIENALHAMPGPGRLGVSARYQSDKWGDVPARRDSGDCVGLGKRDGRRSSGARLRALLLDEGLRHGA